MSVRPTKRLRLTPNADSPFGCSQKFITSVFSDSNKNPVYVNMWNMLGMYVIRYAINSNVEWTLGLLKAQPWLVNSRDEQGYTPLIYAIWNTNVEMQRLLLDMGADPDSKTYVSSWTALFYVAISSQNTFNKNLKETQRCFEFQMTENLFRAGANPNSSDNDGWTPLFYCTMNLPLARQLIFHGANLESLREFVSHNKIYYDKQCQKIFSRRQTLIYDILTFYLPIELVITIAELSYT